MLAKANSEGQTSNNSISQSTSSSPAPPFSTETSQEITHPYPCFRCSRRFSSWHALGGHQNAHKKERHQEHRQYNERRLALKKNSRASSTIYPSPTPPLPVVQPGIAVVSHYSPVAMYGPMVQVQSLGPAGFIYSCYENGPQSPVYMPVNAKVMALDLFTHEEKDLGPLGDVSEDADDHDDDESISKEEDVDLTLRL